ncbi:MAG: hypothetical protein H7Y60_05985 [Rhodospirillaceae bacterium]|nr:hypothetical protein [Rhodospirillales bacterium]
MLTLQDCLDMCDLPCEIVDAIAEHEKVPQIVAAELGNCLAGSNGGLAVIHQFILDDMADAIGRSDYRHLARLEHTLTHFRHSHPGMPAVS